MFDKRDGLRDENCVNSQPWYSENSEFAWSSLAKHIKLILQDDKIW